MGEDGAIIPVEQDTRSSSSFAREMADEYKGFVKVYRERMEMSAAEAHERAVEPADDFTLEHAMTTTPDQVSWHAISAVGERDPALAQQVWQRLVEQARDDLASGNRAARAIEGYQHAPWDRARFLVLRESLAKEWRPANGIEWMLVDMLAQAFTLYEADMQHVMTYMTMEASLNDHQIQKNNKYETPRLTSAEALARVEQGMERYQRMILRVQRALRDQRRYGLNVGSVGQLNIGLMQQNTVSDGKRERNESAVVDGAAKDRGS